MNESYLTLQLKAILGAEGFILLTQALGGTRLYIAYRLHNENEIVRAVGRELADKISRKMAPATIRVPLARRERAIHYYGQGLSYPQIARKLGMTEKGVAKLLKRQQDLPERPKKARSPAQIEMF